MSRRAGLILAVLLILLAVGLGLNAWVDDLARSIAQRPLPTLAPGQTPPPTPAPTLEPGALWSAFLGPSTQVTSSGTVRVRVVRVDDVVLPSGALAAADPFFADAEPFDARFDPGRYPVDLLVGTFDDRDERVVAARVTIPGAAPKEWREARTPTNAAASASPGFFFGYAVDSGTGSFFSPEAGATAMADSGFADRMVGALNRAPNSSWDWADLVVDPSTGANIVAFSSGFGDGAYATYVGLDAGGRPVAFMTDFAILDHP